MARLASPLSLLALLLGIHAAAPAQAEAQLAAPVAEVRALLGADDVDAATEAAERAVAQRAEDAQAWFWAGRAYGLKAMRANLLAQPKWAGRTRDAFEMAVQLDPTHLEARLDLLAYYREAPALLGGGEDKARAQVAEIAARDASLGKFAEATLWLRDEPARGEALLREALALDAGNGRARSALAGLAMQREDWAGARSLWEGALDSESQRAMALYQLGKTAALSGEALEQGLAHLDAFIAEGERPSGIPLAGAHWRRGQILGMLGRRDAAIAALELALADERVRELAQADLERIRGD